MAYCETGYSCVSSGGTGVLQEVMDVVLYWCVRNLNSLWPSDIIWWQEFGSTLTQVMACCLTAPSHYLNQSWLIISEVLEHSPESNFAGNAQKIYSWYELKDDYCKITGTYELWVLIPILGCSVPYLSRVKYETDVTPVYMHWNSVSFALKFHY